MPEQVETAARRSQSYWLLSRLFLEQPDKQMLDELALALKTAVGEDKAGEAGLAELQAAVQTALARPQGVTDLQVEYTRLLSGVSKVSGAPELYESMAREGRLLGDSSEDVAAAYLEAGYENLVPDAGPPDHVGTELRFMSVLCFREMEAWRDSDESAARGMLERELHFFDEHVAHWIPQLCDRLAELTTQAYYLAVATLTAAACRRDREEVAAFVDAYC